MASSIHYFSSKKPSVERLCKDFLRKTIKQNSLIIYPFKYDRLLTLTKNTCTLMAWKKCGALNFNWRINENLQIKMIEENQITPQSERELKKWMKENCFNFNSYSINGNAIYEGFGIDKANGLFTWFYTERGQRENLNHFKTEKEIIEYAFNQIKSDKWAQSHCIGFTTNEAEKFELKRILTGLNIAFSQDSIPYYGPNKPVYRTFVFGCDITKVAELKKKYHHEQ